MPVYVYEHEKGKGCELGKEFEVVQPINDQALKKCPKCRGKVHRIIMPPMTIKSPKSNSDLKSMGFTKLVRRDKGVYENVTAIDGESKIFEAGKPETMPHLRKKITD